MTKEENMWLSCVQVRRQDFLTEGAKGYKWGQIFQYTIGCMQQLGDRTWNGGAQFLNGETGHNWSPADDGSAYV